MQIITIMLPDFALILIGFLLFRSNFQPIDFWNGLEKLVYFILFPALLFYSTSRTAFDFAETGKLLQSSIAATMVAIAFGWLAKPFFLVAPMVFESGVQTAFRFNSYIGLALASRIAGEMGTSLMALLIGFGVPLCNAAAVHALSHKKSGLFKALARNPLLLATVAGVLFSVTGLHFPEPVNAVLSRLGNASIAIGLICVGAGLRLSGVHRSKLIGTYFLAVKLVLLPATAYFLGRWMGLTTLHLQILIVFCALPTASSAYVLATRMGGDGPFVAFLISSGTLISVVTLPLWLLLVS